MTMLPPDPWYVLQKDMGIVFCLMVRNVNGSDVLYAGTETGLVHIWDLKTKRETATFESSKKACISLKSHEETQIILTHDKAGVIRFWKEEDRSWSLLKELETDYFGFCKLVLHRDTVYLPVDKAFVKTASVKELKSLESYDVSQGGDGSGENQSISVFGIFRMNTTTFCLIGYETCELTVWDASLEKAVSRLKMEQCPLAVGFTDVSMRGVCGGTGEKLVVFTMDKSLGMRLKTEIALKNPGTSALAIRPDGRLLAVGCWDSKLRLYSMKSLALLAVLDIHSATVQDVIFCRALLDGEKRKYYLAAGSKDCKVSLWDLYN